MNFTVITGDVIRSYDFKPMVGREDCFVEGEVIDCNAIAECGYNAYKIKVTKDCFDGRVATKKAPMQRRENRVGQNVFVPWKVSFSEFQGRVINLSRI
jgi:hypothetical protein